MLRTAAILALSTMALAACSGEKAPEAPQAASTPEAAQKDISVTDAWVRLPAAPGRPGAAYFTMAAGADSDILEKVTSPAAGRIEFHQTLVEGGVSRMEKFDVHAMGPGMTLEFAPGGKHLMLFDLKPEVAAGQTIPLTFEFQRHPDIIVEAQVRAAGG